MKMSVKVTEQKSLDIQQLKPGHTYKSLYSDRNQIFMAVYRGSNGVKLRSVIGVVNLNSGAYLPVLHCAKDCWYDCNVEAQEV